nr:MAG TPA: hypothetical protein [Caudoviricetes sp.]
MEMKSLPSKVNRDPGLCGSRCRVFFSMVYY